MNRLAQSATPKESHLAAWVLTSSILSAWLCAPPIAAQIVPDATLPAGERSQVSGNVQIDGGARRGGNLFHSFSQFSIPTGGSAYFNNAADIQNIFSRVTGGSISDIDGLIRANGTANLFLLNPNGILFGPNASLNLGGSFVGTTAHAIGFPNGEVFSSDATQPLPNQLLTINPNAFFFNQLTPQPIINQSTTNETGLQVPLRQNLLLIGGPVQLEGGRLISPGSYVELAGIGGIGIAALSTASEDWQLTIPDEVTRDSVSLTNESDINVKGAGGSIRMLAQNIDLSNSRLRIEIPSDSRVPTTQTGDLELNATGSISISNSILANSLFGEGTMGSLILTAGDRITINGSSLYSTAEPDGLGAIGDVTMTARTILFDNALFVANTSQQTDASDVFINARDTVSLNGSSIYNTVEQTGIGNGGDINIATGSLALANGAQLFLNTSGQGDVGSININARDTVSLDGSAILNTVESTGIGDGGAINIKTGSLALTRAGQLTASTEGQGNAGSVTINARDRVSLDGEALDGEIGSAILLRVEPGGVGRGGNLVITTGSLSLTNGGAVNTATDGQGNAGRVTIQARDSVQIRGRTAINPVIRSGIFTTATEESVGDGGDVTITTGSLSVSKQGQIITDVRSRGNAGNIQIQASDAVSFDGGDAISTLSSGGVGRGGDINIAARSLSVLNNAQLSAATAGEGNAGKITVSADTVGVNSGGRLLTTTSSNGRAGDITVRTPDLELSGITSGLFAGTTNAGDAGNLTIQPRGNGQSVRVNLQDGAQISASTSSSGRGGALSITAPGSITLTGNGSIITAGTGGNGAGGNLNLTTGTLNIQNQAEVTVSSVGTGSAGSLFVNADRIYLSNQGSIRADTTGGGGNIDLRSPFTLLRNGSNITTNATGSNVPGGNIAIDTRFLIAVPNEDSNISANSEDFRGGNVGINAFAIYGIQPRPIATPLSDITATGATSALSGTIDVITSGLDPTAGLVALPTDLVDSSRLIAQRCPANQGNSFVISGRGGLPPTPEQQLDDDAEWSDRRRLVVAQKRDQGSRGRGDAETRRRRDVSYAKSPGTSIIEATGVQVTSTGEIVLVASTPDLTVQNRLNQAVTCQGR